MTIAACCALLPSGCRESADLDNTLHAFAREGFPLPAEDWRRLRAAGWDKRVGDGLGLWASVARQRLVGIERGKVRFAYDCSTAARGIGNRTNSYKTPLGWHAVGERFGKGLPWGAIFEERKYTGKTWAPRRDTEKDLILSRILWLRGLEPGVNRGKRIDSHDRYIYIHGTPAEKKLGTPASRGCIRLSNDDVIELFDATKTGTRLLITKW